MSLPAGWEEKLSRSKQVPYYYNTLTGDSQWELPTEPAEASLGEQVRARHILVKHAESRNPKSWKQDPITRSKDEAREILAAIREKVVAAPDTFSAVAESESDCSSHSQGGDLGSFGRGDMQKPFEDATFALQVGDISEIVDTASGLHVIIRDE